MIRPGIILLLLVAAASAKRIFKYQRLVSGEEEIEEKVRELFTGVGTDDAYHTEHGPFPYDDPSLYTDVDALRNFTTYWNQGFLVKNGIFTINCRRTIRDTLSLYHLFNATKDFDTFYKVASWAKKELHPEMYTLPAVAALYERKDTAQVRIPPMYEILPSYFVPSTLAYQARIAYMHDVRERSFQINNTGWEWTWHQGGDMRSPHVVYNPERRNYDVETRLSYFREDVRGLNFIATHLLHYGLVAPNTLKNATTFERTGEIRHSFLHWLLARYNLERYAVNLPPTKPIIFNEPIVSGYDPAMTDIYGRPIPARGDNAVPQDIDPEGVAAVEKIVRRIHDVVEGGLLRNWTEDGLMRHVEGIEAINVVGNKMIAGDDKYYPSLYFNLLSLIDGLVTANNRIEFGVGVLRNALTVGRDPAYYQILAYLHRYFTKLHEYQKPYTKKELGFPGIKVQDVKVSKLETFFEFEEFNITNLLPGEGGSGYKASQFRINNHPFDMVVKIRSDKETNGVVKVFLGPAYDSINTSLNINELRKAFVPFYSFPVKLQSGENVFKRYVIPDTPEYMPYQHGESYIRQWCYYPRNMMLPKGTSEGTPYILYVMVYPYEGDAAKDDTTQYDTKQRCIKQHLMDDYQHSLLFPIDRHWEQTAVQQENHQFLKVFIYHNEDPRKNPQPRYRPRYPQSSQESDDKDRHHSHVRRH